ncbi:MAG: glycogen/starch synthase, partial [Acholeplasma sp.]|nr:glycogen/starch synthase [Acholeplasma sp.]
MRVLFAASEVFPFSKTGGLADMGNFLPLSLNKIGHNVTVITPYYLGISKYHQSMQFLGEKTVFYGDQKTTVNFFRLEHKGVEVVFVQNQHFFERDRLYGYDDDDQRFIVFSYAVLEYVDMMNEVPQIIHVNDWQTATIPFLLDEHYRYRSKYQYIHTLLTIHNLEYQGSFSLDTAKYFNVDFNYTYIHFDAVNYLKTGIERATKINTVSPNYRNEIVTSKYGFSLDGSLVKRTADLLGILNGIDYDIFNPETDELIAKNYSTRNLKLGKKTNKKAVLEYFGMKNDLDRPLLVYIGRLAKQKGINFFEESLETLINTKNFSLVIL